MSLKNTVEIARTQGELIANELQSLSLTEIIAAIVGRGTAKMIHSR